MKALALLLALVLCARAAAPIRFHTASPGFVSLAIYRADGTLARQLFAGDFFAAGDIQAVWDGAIAGRPAPPGVYTWRAMAHDALGLKGCGCIGDFGGDRGAPSAAATDDTQVYLGWSLASADADAVIACDPAGVVRWTHRRGALSGCRALAVDAGAVFVLGGDGADAEGRSLYKLSAKDGAPIRWPDGRTDLPIASLWPANGGFKPSRADYLAVKNGRIYLSFTAGQFIAVLDAGTGKYLQTIVGAPPGPLDSVATKSDAPDKPGALMDADFLVTALSGGAIGKILLAHDPIWVLASELTALGPGQRIAALSIVGDGVKHHREDIFVGLGPPSNQVQARSAIDTDTISFVAGQPGGRPPLGPWQPARMGAIHGVALDAAGQLWVAEEDPIPGRVSVWTTDGSAGRLAREFFAPPDPASPFAIDPLDPRLVYAGGCEWRIDPATGRAACLGVVTRDPSGAARFAIANGHLLLVLTPASGAERVFERAGDGDYRPSSLPPPAALPAKFQILATPGSKWRLATAEGCDLGPLPDPGGAASGAPSLVEMPDGKLFLAARPGRIRIFQLTGIDSLHPLAAGAITIR